MGSSGISVNVDKVNLAEKPIEEKTIITAIQKITRKKIETCSEPYSNVIPCNIHPLMEASHAAYNDHRPLILSPDMIWLTIVQGISYHVNANAEALRKQFVYHDGQKEIIVQRDSFIKGSHDNDWPNALNEFSTQISGFMVPEAYTDIGASFSTTGQVEKTAYDICLMDTVKNYFRYTMRTMCGIPEVHMEGGVSDWVALQEKVESLNGKYGLDWWLKHLIPTVTGMAQSAKSSDGKFWQNWYKLSGGSGGPYISGQIVNLFPYVKNYNDRDSITLKNGSIGIERGFGGLTSDKLPGGMSSVPFNWEYYSQTFKMKLMSGFVGYTQNSDTLALRPKIGWAVMDEDAPFADDSIQTCTKCGESKMIEDFEASRRSDKPGLCQECLWSNN